MYHSAIARFFAFSDLCGAGAMYQERIHSNPNWHNKYARRDTVFVETGGGQGAMQGMVIGRVHLFFSFALDKKSYQCALIEWFIPRDEPDKDTEMWVVRPEFQSNGRRTIAVIHLDCIDRAVHLLPVFGSAFVPDELLFSDSLDVYRAYFVNNNIDHHCHEFLSAL